MPHCIPFFRSLLLIAVTLLLAACAKEQVFQQEAFVFGTRVELSVFGPQRPQAETALAAVLREFDRLHNTYHAWQPSELTALNEKLARGETAEVTPELAAILKDAQQIARTGDGLFDPALGRLIALWGFHSDSFIPQLPDRDALQALINAHPRMSDLTIQGNEVLSSNRAVKIDLGGYLKGYALDRAAALLREKGVNNALINIGGNVMAIGSKGDRPWRVGIRHPRESGILATLPLYDGEAVGTSGDYQRFFELDGRRYSHLLDPRTGWPATDTIALTILITPRDHAGTLSDAPSKPAFIAGGGWRDQVRRFGIDHALRMDANGQIEVTRALRARLQIPSGIKMTVVD